MNIQLNKIIPLPLKEKILSYHSDVWNKEVVFKKGEWIKIKAPSGTGKTTFIHSLYQLRKDYDGTIVIAEKNAATLTADALAILRQQNMAIVFQDLRLFPQLTVKENIELKRVLQKPMYDSVVIEEMADQLQIKHILNQKAAICSYGEQQRVAIIRALVQPFQWLLMDEPFSHLDNVNIQKAIELISEECKKRNAGFVLTDLEEDSHFSYTVQLKL